LILKAERYVATDAGRKGARVEVRGVFELPEGVDAVLLVRSDLERPAMQNAILALQEHAFTATWPPSAEDGGDKAHLAK
jgi:hypothetical protein